jgi:hypothetical protein
VEDALISRLSIITALHKYGEVILDMWVDETGQIRTKTEADVQLGIVSCSWLKGEAEFVEDALAS